MEAVLDPAVERRGGAVPRAGPAGLRLTLEDLEAYVEELSRRGRVAGTLESYRRNVHALYDDLPEDKTVRPGGLKRWQRDLLAKGYSPRTVNARISAVNGLVDFLGRRDLQYVGSLETEGPRPELTRAEYLRLLSTARALDKERLYLLIKLFGCTGISVQELPQVTVEALKRGRVVIRGAGGVRRLHLPEFLQRELLSYARRAGTASGPVFRTKSGKPLSRTAVTDSIRRLCRDARVPEEKGNPRCLKRLWQSTQDEIRAQIDLLVERACDQLMEMEQLSIGWESDKGVRGP